MNQVSLSYVEAQYKRQVLPSLSRFSISEDLHRELVARWAAEYEKDTKPEDIPKQFQSLINALNSAWDLSKGVLRDTDADWIVGCFLKNRSPDPVMKTIRRRKNGRYSG